MAPLRVEVTPFFQRFPQYFNPKLFLSSTLCMSTSKSSEIRTRMKSKCDIWKQEEEQQDVIFLIQQVETLKAELKILKGEMVLMEEKVKRAKKKRIAMKAELKKAINAEKNVTFALITSWFCIVVCCFAVMLANVRN